MPNDAKLGLVVGVGLVITVAVLFFHKEGPTGSTASELGAGRHRPSHPVRRRCRAACRPAPPRPAPPAAPRNAEPTGGRRHTVREGDTLFSLARQYYGDAEQFGVIYQANRGVLREPDPLPVGAELVIPQLPNADSP